MMTTAVELLYIGELRVNETVAELLGQTDAAQPTFVNCRQAPLKSRWVSSILVMK